jgi:hypothetical protein
MADEYRPNAKMYEVTWELDGECQARFATHAADQVEAFSKAQAFFDQHPEHDFLDRARMKMRARDVKDDQEGAPES